MPSPPRTGEGRTHCRYHCSPCGCCFVSLSAFDKHRVGTYQRGRRCAAVHQFEDRRGLRIVTADGICDAYEHVDPAVVWGLP